MSGKDFISFGLNNEDRYLSRVSTRKKALIKVNKKFGYKTVCITLDGTEEHPRDLVLKIKEIQRQVKENQPQ